MKKRFTEGSSPLPCGRRKEAPRLPRCAARWGSASNRFTVGSASTMGWVSPNSAACGNSRRITERLKKLVADLALDKHILQEVLQKKV